MSEAWPDTFDDRCILQFQPGVTYKIQKHKIPHMEHLLDDQENHPIKPRMIKSCATKRNIKSQCKLTQIHDHNYTMEGKPLQNID